MIKEIHDLNTSEKDMKIILKRREKDLQLGKFEIIMFVMEK